MQTWSEMARLMRRMQEVVVMADEITGETSVRLPLTHAQRNRLYDLAREQLGEHVADQVLDELADPIAAQMRGLGVEIRGLAAEMRAIRRQVLGAGLIVVMALILIQGGVLGVYLTWSPQGVSARPESSITLPLVAPVPVPLPPIRVPVDLPEADESEGEADAAEDTSPSFLELSEDP